MHGRKRLYIYRLKWRVLMLNCQDLIWLLLISQAHADMENRLGMVAIEDLAKYCCLPKRPVQWRRNNTIMFSISLIFYVCDFVGTLLEFQPISGQQLNDIHMIQMLELNQFLWLGNVSGNSKDPILLQMWTLKMHVKPQMLLNSVNWKILNEYWRLNTNIKFVVWNIYINSECPSIYAQQSQWSAIG